MMMMLMILALSSSPVNKSIEKRYLDIVEVAHGMSFEVEFDELQTNVAATRHGDVPEALGGVSVRQRVVRRHETARKTTQLAATTYTHSMSFRCGREYAPFAACV